MIKFFSKNWNRRSKFVSDESGYYLVKFPKNMSRSRRTFVGEVVLAVHDRELPLIFDFSDVKKFDSSGEVAVVALLRQYECRGIFAYGVSEVITREIEVVRLGYILGKEYLFMGV